MWEGEGISIYFQEEELCCIGQVSKGASYVYWVGCWFTGWKECVAKLHSSVRWGDGCWSVNIVSFIHISIYGLNILTRVSWTFCPVRCCSCMRFSLLYSCVTVLLSFSTSLLQNSMKKRCLLFMIWQVKLFHLTCGRFWSSYIRLVYKYFVMYK